MASATDDILRDLLMADHEAAYAANADEAYKHLRIMANRIHPDTRVVQSVYRLYYASEATLRQAKAKYGLRQVPGHLYQIS